MRKITTLAISAFMNAESFKENNTTVEVSNFETVLRLHGNAIARKNKADGSTQISNCGWQTNTTKERLNGIPGVSISQKKGVWYLNGEEWDGSLKTV